MDDCMFCKIARGEIPCSKIYEDQNILAFLDIMPVNKGHALVIPKAHFEDIFQIPDDLLAEITSIVKKVSIAVKHGVEADGINLLMNNQKAAGQVVPHAHFHIIPRHKGDGLQHWEQREYEEDEIGLYKDMINKHL
jgi:histidine triad (HIT) family protein